MADLKMMLQNLRDKSKCCKKDDFTGERYTIIHDMSIETLNMICDDGIEQFENAQIVNRWIPCRERLPKSVGNKVLVFCTGEDVNDYVGFGHYEVFKNTVTWYNLETSLPFADWGLTVTHWMPLPEPPAFCGKLVEGGADDAT